MRSLVTDRVAWSVCRSVCLSVTLVSPAKRDEPIEMPFGLRTRVDPGNHVLDGGPDPPWEGSILREKGRPIVKYVEPCIRLRSRFPHGKGQFWGNGAPTAKYRDTLRSRVPKRLNRSICRLRCGLRWKHKFSRIR